VIRNRFYRRGRDGGEVPLVTQLDEKRVQLDNDLQELWEARVKEAVLVQKRKDLKIKIKALQVELEGVVASKREAVETSRKMEAKKNKSQADHDALVSSVFGSSSSSIQSFGSSIQSVGGTSKAKRRVSDEGPANVLSDGGRMGVDSQPNKNNNKKKKARMMDRATLIKLAKEADRSEEKLAELIEYVTTVSLAEFRSVLRLFTAHHVRSLPATRAREIVRVFARGSFHLGAAFPKRIKENDHLNQTLLSARGLVLVKNTREGMQETIIGCLDLH